MIFSISDGISIGLAVVALAALVSSIWLSKKTNDNAEDMHIKNEQNTKGMHKQNQTVLKRQNSIAMFDKRFEVIESYYKLLMDGAMGGEILKRRNLDLLTILDIKVKILFDSEYTKMIISFYNDILKFHTNKTPMPDYVILYKDKIIDDGNMPIELLALILHVGNCMGELLKQFDDI